MDTDTIGGFPIIDPNCKGCGKPLTIDNAWMADGCPCNTALGVNSMNETRWRLLMELQQTQSRQLQNGDYVAWCRYTATTIITCDSDAENAFRVYRRTDDPDTMAKFCRMSDCLDNIRKILDVSDYASRLNRLQAIRDLINFDLPDTPNSLIPTLQAELDECRTYHEPRIAELERLALECQHRNADLCIVIGDIEQCRCMEGDSIAVLCDNPEAETAETQAVVEACGDYTGYEPQRFYGRTWSEALHEAANCARRHYSDNDEHE